MVGLSNLIMKWPFIIVIANKRKEKALKFKKLTELYENPKFSPALIVWFTHFLRSLNLYIRKKEIYQSFDLFWNAWIKLFEN